MGKVILFCMIFLFFALLFYWMGKERLVNSVLYRARNSLEGMAEKRTKEYRNSLTQNYRRKGVLYKFEKLLVYSGISVRFPGVTPEIGITACIVAGSMVYFGLVMAGVSWTFSVLMVLVGYMGIYLLLNLLMLRNFNKTDGELLKFLDFLGNYSITSGEVTSVLHQISGYLEAPLKNVLEEGYYEAQTLGNTSLALLQMAEKIQHPKFKEIIYNMEITLRYSADFTTLVGQSRRSVREDMKLRQERKSMAKEAWVNIMILGAMTIIILEAVEVLIGVPITDIVLGTWVGRICLSGIGVILLLFVLQVRKISM